MFLILLGVTLFEYMSKNLSLSFRFLFEENYKLTDVFNAVPVEIEFFRPWIGNRLS